MSFPRILPPVAINDRRVWVSNVPRGSTVTIREGTRTLGSRVASEPVVAVPVDPVGGPIRARTHLAGRTVVGHSVSPIRDPGEAGEFPRVRTREIHFAYFNVPTHDTPEGVDGGFRVPLRCRLYLPADENGQVPAQLGHRPLVIIAHGYWLYPEDLDSRLGYAWLAEHLARWGIVACSIDLSEVNLETGPVGAGPMQQWARGEVILKFIERVVDDPLYGDYVDPDRVGLVGHSMGGEGVVMAQVINLARSRWFGIRGVVSLAPTNYRPEYAATHTAYLQLHGSLDYLLSSAADVTGANPRFGGLRHYDRAWRPRTLVWLEGARHEGWNPLWLDSPGSLEPPPAPELPVMPAERQQAIGRAFITAFFLDVLAGQDEYRGYLGGPALPQAVADAVVHRQHQQPSVAIMDDFGDANDQLLLPAENPLDKTVNRRGQPAQAASELWEEVDHRTLQRSVHQTRGVDLSWRNGSFTYETGTDGLELAATDVLSLRVAQHYSESSSGVPDETWNRVGQEIDLLVELSDGDQLASVSIGAIAAVPYPLPGFETYSVFRTVRIPLDAFTAANPDLNIGAVRRVRLSSTAQRRNGRLLVDDIEFETAELTPATQVRMLRVHELGTGYGPPRDHIDTEVIVHLAARPGESFGFTLRNDELLPVNQQKLALLRAALTNRRPVRLGYHWAGPTTRTIVRVIPA